MAQLDEEILVFGDQSSNYGPALQDLLLKKDSPYLIFFLEEANRILRQEIASLSTAERSLFPSFTSIQELVSKLRNRDAGPALDSILACCYHISSIIQ